MAVYRHRGGMRGPDTRTSALATRFYLPEKRLAGDPLRRELGGRCDRREAYVYPVSAVVMSVVAWLVPQRAVDWQPDVFWALAYSAILATALAWSLWLFVLRNLPASIAGLSTLAVPVCGVLFSWWLLHENPGKVEGCGIALRVLALAMISIKRRGA